jgi:hypothetical protein
VRRFRSFVSAWFTVMRINQVENRESSRKSLEGLQEGLLNRVLGVFPIVRDVFSNSEEFAIVSLYELLESRYISILSGMDEIQIIGSQRLPCELCQVCRHIRSSLWRTTALGGN